MVNNYKIGFGTYRMSIDIPQHYDALVYGIQNGCRLIDTASNYRQGKSEELIGKVINEDRFKALDIMVVSKAGYVDTNELPDYKQYSHKINDRFYYSFHPDFLRYKVKMSQLRIARKKIHAYLIHNPEYLLNIYGEAEFYEQLKLSFQLLEELVSSGEIDFYGVSSNTIVNNKHSNYLDPEKLLAIAKQINSDHHFRYIQFPFNFYERQAEDKIYESNTLNLFEYAYKNNIITLINRPFLASIDKKPVKLVMYKSNNFESENHKDHFLEFKNQLKELAGKNKIEIPFESIVEFDFLNVHWKKFKSEKLLNMFFEDKLYPILLEYGFEKSDREFANVVKVFLNGCTMHIKKSITKRNEIIKAEIIEKNTVFNPRDSFASLLCRFYLKQGADIVLTGMRKKDYVNDLKNLLQS